MMPLIGYDADSESSEIAENSSTASDDSGRTTESTQRSNSSAASLLMAHHVQQGMPRLGDAPRQIDAGESYNIANDDTNDTNSGGGGASSSSISSNSSSSSNNGSIVSNSNNNRSVVFSIDPPPADRDPLSLSTGRTGNRHAVRTRQRRLRKIHTTLLQSKKYLHRTVGNLSCIRNLLRQQLQMARTLFTRT